MARYDFSIEGAAQLNELANTIMNCVSGIADHNLVLNKTITGLSNELGIYSEQIINLINENNHALGESKDSIYNLCGKIKALSEAIRDACGGGLGGGNDGAVNTTGIELRNIAPDEEPTAKRR